MEQLQASSEAIVSGSIPKNPFYFFSSYWIIPKN